MTISSNIHLRGLVAPASGLQTTLLKVCLFWLSLWLIAASSRGQMPHDCVPYEPSATGGAIAGAWNGPDDIDFYGPGMTIPVDPGGGYAAVTLSTSQGTSEPTTPIPALQLDNFPDPGNGVLLGGSAAQSANELERFYILEVAGGASYSFESSAFFDPPEFPWNYSITWTFFSRVDCYEPNNEREDAKAIPLSLPISAYGISGHVDLPLLGRNYDWFKFTLDETTEVTIETLQVPSDQQINIRVLNEAGALWHSAFPDNPGELVEIGPVILPPDTWYLEVEADTTGKTKIDVHFDGAALPDHFDTPYRLWVAKTEDLLFRDDFELGDTMAWSSSTR